MLTVSDCAIQLDVSPARVRALIKAGALPALKHGREWMLREEDVLQRKASKPRAGRPKLKDTSYEEEAKASREANATRAHEAYKACRQIFRHCPSPEMMKSAESQEEAAFYMAASTFFLQQQQATLIANGVF